MQEPLVSSVLVEVEVAPLTLEMSPLDQHVDEGGRISVTCTAKQVIEYTLYCTIHTGHRVSTQGTIHIQVT